MLDPLALLDRLGLSSPRSAWMAAYNHTTDLWLVYHEGGPVAGFSPAMIDGLPLDEMRVMGAALDTALEMGTQGRGSVVVTRVQPYFDIPDSYTARFVPDRN